MLPFNALHMVETAEAASYHSPSHRMSRELERTVTSVLLWLGDCGTSLGSCIGVAATRSEVFHLGQLHRERPLASEH